MKLYSIILWTTSAIRILTLFRVDNNDIVPTVRDILPTSLYKFIVKKIDCHKIEKCLLEGPQNSFLTYKNSAITQPPYGRYDD